MISAAADHYASNLPLPERLSDSDLRRLAMPVYTALGARSSMHDAGEAQQAAQENVRNLRIRIWPDATHSLPMEVAPQLDRELLRFFAENEVGR